jgi:uncharacterized protein (DUF697 family)
MQKNASSCAIAAVCALVWTTLVLLTALPREFFSLDISIIGQEFIKNWTWAIVPFLLCVDVWIGHFLGHTVIENFKKWIGGVIAGAAVIIYASVILTYKMSREFQEAARTPVELKISDEWAMIVLITMILILRFISYVEIKNTKKSKRSEKKNNPNNILEDL